jgi:uncharacterized membrane protein YhaH (DUF805 family)
MILWNALKQAFKLYATFSGRTNRPDYWYFILASAIISTALGLIYTAADGNQPLSDAWTVVTLVPSLAAGARRLTDAGSKRTDLFWLLLPLIGWGIFIYKAAQPSVAAK